MGNDNNTQSLQNNWNFKKYELTSQSKQDTKCVWLQHQQCNEINTTSEDGRWW